MKDTLFPPKFTLNIKGILHEFKDPQIMGIINTTPDSFYSGSRKATVEACLKTASTMLDEGARFIDIGGYSSRPGASVITTAEEIERTSTIIKELKNKYPTCLISIDTFRSEVAEHALKNGADIINDISAGKIEPRIMEIAAAYSCPYIMMHMRGTPQTMNHFTQYNQLIPEILNELRTQTEIALKTGIKDIIIDPGLGFSKTIEQNFELLRKLELLALLDFPILVGVSRKSMLYKTLNITAENALNATTFAHTIALSKGANILRVHDVKEANETILLMKALNGSNINPPE